MTLYETEKRNDKIQRFGVVMTPLSRKNIYQIINNYSTSVRYEMKRDSQRGAQRRVSYNHLISNKREWNNCFIKNAPKILDKSSNSSMTSLMAKPIKSLQLHYPMIQFLKMQITTFKAILARRINKQGCEDYENSFARMESDCTLRFGIQVLIKSISNSKQSNFSLHFLSTLKRLCRS